VKYNYRCHFETAFLLLLFRLSFPRRIYSDMEKVFGMRRCHISNAIATFAEAFFQMCLPYLNNPAIHRKRIPYYARLIKEKTGGAAINIWSFIDGTLR